MSDRKKPPSNKKTKKKKKVERFIEDLAKAAMAFFLKVV